MRETKYHAYLDSEERTILLHSLALLYGYQGNRGNLSGSDDEKWLATQTLVWEFVTGCREATGSYRQTSSTVYSLHLTTLSTTPKTQKRPSIPNTRKQTCRH